MVITILHTPSSCVVTPGVTKGQDHPPWQRDLLLWLEQGCTIPIPEGRDVGDGQSSHCSRRGKAHHSPTAHHYPKPHRSPMALHSPIDHCLPLHVPVHMGSQGSEDPALRVFHHTVFKVWAWEEACHPPRVLEHRPGPQAGSALGDGGRVGRQERACQDAASPTPPSHMLYCPCCLPGGAGGAASEAQWDVTPRCDTDGYSCPGGWCDRGNVQVCTRRNSSYAAQVIPASQVNIPIRRLITSACTSFLGWKRLHMFTTSIFSQPQPKQTAHHSRAATTSIHY